MRAVVSTACCHQQREDQISVQWRLVVAWVGRIHPPHGCQLCAHCRSYRLIRDEDMRGERDAFVHRCAVKRTEAAKPGRVEPYPELFMHFSNRALHRSLTCLGLASDQHPATRAALTHGEYPAEAIKETNSRDFDHAPRLLACSG